MNISMNPNGELYQSAVNAPGTIEIPESFLNEARQFLSLIHIYPPDEPDRSCGRDQGAEKSGDGSLEDHPAGRGH